MHTSTFFAGTLAIAAIVSAHSEGGIPSAPKLFGRSTLREVKGRSVLPDDKRNAAGPAPVQKREDLKARQVGGTSGTCGKGVASCAKGYCCSAAGYCGTGAPYCAAPDCQINYGSGCDANTVPPGATTSNVARTQVGSVPYGGAGIYDCTTNGMIALTYDDGPYIYTSHILDLLKQYNVPATFFITGNNLGKGEIDNAANPWVSVIQRMHNEGHQIASHTWSHQDLGANAAVQNQETLTRQQRLNQMYYNEIALRNILGFFPTYMRPPYSDCDAPSGCQADMNTLGYHVVYFDLDTADYLNDSPTLIQTSKDIFANSLSTNSPQNGNWLEIGHDIHQQTAYNLTEYMIQYGKAQGWTFGTVGQCLGDPEANWYRSSGGTVVSSSTSGPASSTSTSSSPTSPASPVSTDATCGGAGKTTCQGSGFGNCCSQYGWCGSTTDYCGAGCQPAFGTCG